MDTVVPFLIVCAPIAFIVVVSTLYRRNLERMSSRSQPPDDLRRADDGSGYDTPGESFGSWPNL